MGYPKSKLSKVKFFGYTRRNEREEEDVPFMITNYPSLKNIERNLLPKLAYFIYE